MTKYLPPEKFDFKSPIEWTKWFKRFERYRKVSGLDKDTEENQVDVLIYCLGADAEELLTSFSLSPAQLKVYKTVTTKFEDYFIGKRNTIYERARFNRRCQEEGEPVDQFVTALHVLAEHCDYGVMKLQLIRDRIVVGIRDTELSEKLQLEADLTLEKATTKVRQSEAVHRQQRDLRGSSEADPICIEAVHKQRLGRSRDFKEDRREGYRDYRPFGTGRCYRCGRSHRRDMCPAKDSRCRKCDRVGHFEVVCKSVQELNEESEEYESSEHFDEEPELPFLGHLAINEEEEPAWYVNLSVCDTSMKFKIDTGADVSVVSQSQFLAMKCRPNLHECRFRISSPGGGVLPLGQFIARLTHDSGPVNHQRMIVVHDKCAPVNLLSRTAAVRLNLVQRVDTVSEESVFGLCGKLKGEPVKITLKDNFTPYSVSVPRRIPFPLLPQVEKELKRLVEADIIEPVTKATDWCAPMVPVIKKNGSVRICVDLTALNKNVRRERYMIPTLEDVLPLLKNSTYFSTLDAASGFNQMVLDPDSSDLTTFISPFGRFKYKRLCFGITSAPATRDIPERDDELTCRYSRS